MMRKVKPFVEIDSKDSLEKLNINIYDSIKYIDKEQYNHIVDPDNPFLEYEFLEALEESGCVGPKTTWLPYYIVLSDKGKIVGAITFYIRYDSYGEFIFDWEWAQAYQNARLRYYPKAVVAIPFTPTTGVRILVHPAYSFDECAELMISHLIEFCRQEKLSSVHFLFLTEKEHNSLEKLGFLSRKTHQYHWNNRGYETFDDFLDDLRSNRKKQIRKERRHLEQLGLDIRIIEGEGIEKSHIDAMWRFYMDTHSRKWGSAYLNKKFFDLIFDNFRHRLVLVLAREGRCWIGGTFNLVKGKRLFGRYWGTNSEHENLHFECCFYSLIEYSIKNRIEVFEAGAQGEHKFLRGFAAVPTYSSHFIFHDGAKMAISDYLTRERNYNTRLIEDLNRKSPLKYLHGQDEA